MERLSSQTGFSLVELLVVVAVLGVISAIAVQQFSQYRIRAYNEMAESAVRNTAQAAEAYAERNGGVYPNCSFPVSFGGAPLCQEIMPDFQPNSSLKILLNYGGDRNVIGVCHEKGSKIFQFKDTRGKSEGTVFDCSGSTLTVLSTMRASNTVLFFSTP